MTSGSMTGPQYNWTNKENAVAKFEFDVIRTAEQLATMAMDEGKVYLFIEPTPELLKVVTFGKPDELFGVHCVSITLVDDASLEQAMALTKALAEAEGREDWWEN